MDKIEMNKICRSTKPLLDTHQQAIVTHFYHSLYHHKPSLVLNSDQLSTNQKGEIAESIYLLLTNSKVIDLVLLREKKYKDHHLPVAPEHYPVIGEYLLAAIKEALGNKADKTMLLAWQHTFETLLESFVEEVTDTSQHPSSQTDEDGFRKLVVAKKVFESEAVQSFYLKSIDGTELEPFKPGQHVRIKVNLPGQTETHIRYFSLSDSPEKDYYRITIKKEIPKQEGSLTPTNYVYDHIEAGDFLYVSPPAGEFTLDDSSQIPVVLLSGGVGMTPLVSMLNTIVNNQPERSVTFIHATANSMTHSFRESISDLARNNKNVNSYVCYDHPSDQDRDLHQFDKEGYVTLDFLKSILPDHQADFYFCGPTPFMKAVYTALNDLGVPKNHIHYEYFGPGDLEDILN